MCPLCMIKLHTNPLFSRNLSGRTPLFRSPLSRVIFIECCFLNVFLHNSQGLFSFLGKWPAAELLFINQNLDVSTVDLDTARVKHFEDNLIQVRR